MPSPLAHGAVGYAVYRMCRGRVHSDARMPGLLLGTRCLSMLPNLDATVGLTFGDLHRFHNHFTHSPIVGAVVALGLGGLWSLVGKARFRDGFLAALICYELHVVMDFFTVGRGVMALWPLTADRYEAPFKLFYGLHWSEGWLSVRHAWTVSTELLFLALVAATVRLSAVLPSRSHRDTVSGHKVDPCA